MEKIDLKALARELKEKATTEASKPEPPAIRKPETIRKADTAKYERRSALKSIISSANQRNDFDLRHHVYIDTEIYEILRQIKTQTRLKLGNLASVLFEEFILEHKSEIIALLKAKSNRLI